MAVSTMVYTLAASGGDLFAAVEGRDIQVWDMATLQRKRTLEAHERTVRALVMHAGWLISGSDEDDICVWDVGTGERLAKVQCFGAWYRALAVCGNFLVSCHGMLDDSYGGVRFWRMSKAPRDWNNPDN